MSFQPFTFKYNPPETVPTQVNTTSAAPSAVTSNQSTGTPAVTPVSGYITQLTDLAATAQFLQDLILDKYKTTGITVDPEIDPDTAQALNGCYGTIPPAITSGMFSNLVDANNALNSIGRASQGTSVQADAAAQANVTQIITTVTSHLLSSNRTQDYQLLAGMSLKTDSLVFQGIANSLSVYPATVSPSQEVANLLNDIYSAYSSIYSTLYTGLTVANIINQDINNVLGLAQQAVQDLVRLVATFTFLKGFILKDKGRSIVKTLEGGAAALFCSEVSSALFTVDNLALRAIDPLKGATGLLGSIVSSVKRSITEVESAGHIIDPLRDSTLSGMSTTSPCAQMVLSSYPGANLLPDTNPLSVGLKLIGHYIDSAERHIDGKFGLMSESLAKATLGRAKSYTDLLELTCSLSNIESLISIINQLIAAKNTGLIPPSASTNINLTQVQSFITSTINNPSTSAAVPANVMGVLTAGGYSI